MSFEMNIEITPFNKLPGVQREEVAALLSAYTHGKLDEKPQMLPLSPLDVHAKYMGYVALYADQLAGFIGATTPETWNGAPMPEVGSLWVPMQFRKLGIAHKLVVAISTALADESAVPYAFCNPLSKPIFEHIGYVEAKSDEVPPSAFSLCGACPVQPASGCCDTVLIFTGDKL